MAILLLGVFPLPTIEATHVAGSGHRPIMMLHGILRLGPGEDAPSYDDGFDVYQYFNASEPGSMIANLLEMGWNKSDFVFWKYFHCDGPLSPRDGFPLASLSDYGIGTGWEAHRHVNRLPGSQYVLHDDGSDQIFERDGPGLDHLTNGCDPGEPGYYSGDFASGHTTHTTIRHLAYHFAWAIYKNYQAGPNPTCVDVIAHSMGGLILFYALSATQRHEFDFPPMLCVSNAITFSTPFDAGYPGWAKLCAILRDTSWWDMEDWPSPGDETHGWYECQEIGDPAGRLGVNQGAEGKLPQGIGLDGRPGNTQWANIGNYGTAPGIVNGDDATPSNSATWLEKAQTKVLFSDGYFIGHNGWWSPEQNLKRQTRFVTWLVRGDLWLTDKDPASNWRLDWQQHSYGDTLFFKGHMGEAPLSPAEGPTPSEVVYYLLSGNSWGCGVTSDPTLIHHAPIGFKPIRVVPPARHSKCGFHYEAPSARRLVLAAESPSSVTATCRPLNGSAPILTPPASTAPACEWPPSASSWPDSTNWNLDLDLSSSAQPFDVYGAWFLDNRPTPPIATAAGTAASTYVDVGWKPPAASGGLGVTRYDVERSQSNGAYAVFESVATSQTGSWLVWKDTSVQPSTSYKYRIRASNADGLSEWSASASVTVPAAPPPATAPGTPRDAALRPGDGTMKATWEPPLTNGGSPITGYKVYLGTSSPPPLAATVGPLTFGYDATGLTNGQTYYFAVSAVNGVGESPKTSVAGATAAGLPTAPSLSASAASDSVTLSWSQADGRGSPVTGYRVYRAESGVGAQAIATVSGTSYTDTSVANGRTYGYYVRATNAIGEGASSNSVSVTPNPPQGQPGGACNNNAQIVSWAWDTGYSNPQPRPLGEYQDVWIQVLNTGTCTWTYNPANPWSLGIVGDNRPNDFHTFRFHMHLYGIPDNDNRIGLSPGEEIRPWQFKTFRARIAAPIFIQQETTHYLEFQMVQDGVQWFGQKTPNFGLPVYPHSNAAEVIVDTPPPMTMEVGKMYDVSLRVQNVGYTTWAYTGAQPYSLGLTDDNTNGWLIEFDDRGPVDENRVRFAPGESLSRGQWKTFNIKVGVGPRMTLGTHPLQFRMVQDYVEWFGDKSSTNAWSINAVPRPNNAQLIETSSIPSTLPVGSSVPVRITVKNTGSNPWQPGSMHYLGFVGDNNWPGPESERFHLSEDPYLSGHNRVGFGPGTLITTGATSTFTFTLTPPGTPGTYPLAFRMVQDGVEWFGDTASYGSVSVVIVPPGTPESVRAVPGDRSAGISWNTPSFTGGGVDAYRIYKGTAPGFDTATAESITADGEASSASFADLANAQTYYFRVAAHNPAGWGSPSAEVSATPFGAPAAPSLSASAGNGLVTLSWSPGADNGRPITAYRLFGGTSPDVPLDPGHEIGGIGLSTAFTHAGRSNGVTYYYRVAAENPAGLGSPSAEVSATPATVPSAPQGLTATASPSAVSLSWSVPSSNGGAPVESYAVHWGEAPDALSNARSTTGTSLAIGALQNGRTYYFRVHAMNRAGLGDGSPLASARPVTVPDAPTGLVATPSPGAVSLSWTAPSDGGEPITSYRIYRSVDGCANWQETGQTAPSSPSTVGGLTNGQPYCFKVAAINGVGEGPASGPASAKPAGAPSAPTNLVATAGAESIALSWSAPASDEGEPVTQYRTFLAAEEAGGCGGFTAMGTTSAFSATLTGLTNGRTYCVAVSAVNVIGEGPRTAPVMRTPAIVPSAPSGLVAQRGNALVDLSWTAPDNGGAPITQSRVQWAPMAGGSCASSTLSNSAIVSGASTSHRLADLANGQTYCFSVAAGNRVGEGPASDRVSAKPATIPSTPLGLGALSDQDGRSSVSWSAPTSDGGEPVTQYRPYVAAYGDNACGPFAPLATTSGTSMTITGLTNGQTYCVAVSASNAVGEGPRSDAATFKPARAPRAPSDLVVTRGDSLVDVAWNAPSDDGGSPITEYRIEWGTRTDGDCAASSRPSSATVSSAARSRQVIDLTNGQTYCFAVVAVNRLGQDTTAPAAAKPARAPSWPNGPAATPGDASILLSWAAPTSDGGEPISSYAIYYGLSSGAGTNRITTDTSATSATIAGLTNGVAYYFQVAAVNAVGQGTLSGEVSAIPYRAPDAPTGLAAAASDRTVTLSWNAPGFDGGRPVTSYRIYRSADGCESWQDTSQTAASSPAAVGALTNGQSYCFQVAAINARGEGALGNAASGIPVTVPGAPQGFAGTASDRRVALEWAAPASNGGGAITNYRVYSAGTSDFSPSPADRIAELPSSQRSHMVSGLQNGVTRFYRVAAVNVAGEGSATSALELTPLAVPGPVRLLAATAGNREVRLAWQPPTDDGGTRVTYYKIYRTEAEGPSTLRQLVTAYPNPQFTDTGLVNGRSYSYTVETYNAVGAGLPPAPATAVPAVTPPEAPTNVRTSAGSNQVTIHWAPPRNDGGGTLLNYVAWRLTDAGPVAVCTQPSTAVTFVCTDSAAVNGFTYRYLVRVTTSVGTSPDSTIETVTPSATARPPFAPTGLAATSNADEAILLTWSPAPGSPTAYKIYRGTGGAKTYLAKIGPATSWTDSGLRPDSAYTYTVTAVNAQGESGFSNDATATPLNPNRASAARNLAANVGVSRIDLSWDPPTQTHGIPVSAYKVFRGTAAGQASFIGTVSAPTTAYSDTSLVGGQTYYYQVAASNWAGDGHKAAEVSATARMPPSAPLSVTATGSDQRIHLSWSVPSNDGGGTITAYKVGRSTAPGQETWIGQTSVLSYDDAALTNGVTYYYVVAAINEYGTGPNSAEASATPARAPGPPVGLTTLEGNQQVTLSWTPPVSDGGAPITGYEVWRSETPGAQARIQELPGSARAFSNMGLTNGVTYYYIVKAVNRMGVGDPSAERAATPATVPGIPLSLAAEPGATGASLTWSPPSSNGGAAIDYYNVWRRASSGTSELVGSQVTGTSFQDSNLASGATYYYSVEAHNRMGLGPRSGEVVLKTGAPASPRNLVATNGAAFVDLRWDAVTNWNGATDKGYCVYRGTSSGAEVRITSPCLTGANGADPPTTYRDFPPDVLTTYYYYVTATNGAKESPPSNEVTGKGTP